MASTVCNIPPLDPLQGSNLRLVARRGPGATDAAHFSRGRPQMKSRGVLLLREGLEGPGCQHAIIAMTVISKRLAGRNRNKTAVF